MSLVLPSSGQSSSMDHSGEIESSSSRERPVRWVGKYRILSELGRGGMANVYLAVARGPGGVAKLVVLKALLPELASEPGALAMFLDEARLAAQLNHANVVQTYEVGTEGERQVIVMEYLEGQSLAQIIKRAELSGRPMPPGMAVRIVINALEGLHYAHDLSSYDGAPLSLVHRDVSPQNIFVTYDGQVKVLDFGIAKAASSSTHTATGIVKGKIAYMAPEQMVGDNVDRRADVFSIGCMLWAFATGKKLWKDTPDVHIMRRVINAEIPNPQSVNPAVDDELDRIVMRALAAERNDRYQTALELQEDLERYLDERSLTIKQKEIGNFVSTLFADTRAELKALIERQITLAASDEFIGTADFSRSEVRTSTSGSGSGASAGSVARTLQSVDGTGLSGSQSTAVGNPRARWVMVAGLLLLGGGVVYALGKSRQDPPPVVAAPRAPAPANPTVAPPAQPTLATMQLRASPPEAQLFLNDEPLPSNPTAKVLPINGSVFRLRAEAPGYATGVEEFSPSRDAEVEIALQKVGAPATEKHATRPGVRGPRQPVVATPAPKPSAAAPAPAPKPNCSQPFFVDSDGIKKLRAECR
ncbi:MAG TPA: serine/threonine-protein kinase [Polyangiaceae bacterium]|nr:serine/threonine-protein kinase [Polyangiaceae bacterium]